MLLQLHLCDSRRIFSLSSLGGEGWGEEPFRSNSGAGSWEQGHFARLYLFNALQSEAAFFDDFVKQTGCQAGWGSRYESNFDGNDSTQLGFDAPLADYAYFVAVADEDTREW